MTSTATRTRRFHPAWIVAIVAFLALVGAAGFRAAPSVLMLPGVVRDTTGEYSAAWFGAAGLCLVAAVVSATITRRKAVVVT